MKIKIPDPSSKHYWILVSLLIVILTAIYAQNYFYAECSRDSKASNYLSALKSCSNAHKLSWPFQQLTSVQYAIILNNLGAAELAVQHYTGARRHLSEALRWHEQLNPQGSQEQARTLNNLALVSKLEGDTKQEELLFREAVAMFDRFGGPCDADSAAAYAKLGTALYDIEKPVEAETLLLARSRQNDACPFLQSFVKGLTLRILAEAQHKIGKEEDALSTIDAALVFLKQEPGDGSLEVAYALVDRAHVLRGLGRLQDGQESLALALPIFERWVGDDSVAFATAKASLGDMLMDQGKPDEAIVAYGAVEKIYRLRLGENHPWRALLLMRMAKVTRTLGLKSDAASMLREAERIRIALYGSESPQVARVRELIEGQNDER